MVNKGYLTADEQFKKTLNNEEIARINDNELLNIRSKYWNLRHKAFLDEHHISDSELGKVWDRYFEQEKIELGDYITRHGLNYKLSW